MERNRTIVKGIFVVVFFLIGSKMLSFFVEILIANSLGATKESDIYYIVYGVYTIIGPMLSIGIWKVYMPVYKEYCVVRTKEEAAKVTDKLLVIFSCIAFLIALIINIVPHLVLQTFAPGFTDSEVNKAVPLLRLVSTLFLITTIHTFSSAILQSNNKFEKSQIKGIIQHIPSLVYLLLCHDKITVYGLIISVVCGEIITLVIMNIFVNPFYSFTYRTKIFDNEIKKILLSVPIACIIVIINQVNGIVDKAFASTLQEGAVTCLNYGNKLSGFFDGIFSTAISTAVFPTLTEIVVRGKKEQIEEILKKYLSILACPIILVTGILVVFSKEIVTILFQRGMFDANSVQVTAGILSVSALGLLALCFNTIINDVLYIRKQMQIILTTTIFNVVFNIVLNTVFVKYYGVVGLSIATVISLYVTLSIKLVYFGKQNKIEKQVYKNIGFTIIVGFCSCIIASAIQVWIENIWLRMVLGGVLFAVVYIAGMFCQTFYRRTMLGGIKKWMNHQK